jgi:hypothetical protein
MIAVAAEAWRVLRGTRRIETQPWRWFNGFFSKMNHAGFFLISVINNTSSFEKELLSPVENGKQIHWPALARGR